MNREDKELCTIDCSDESKYGLEVPFDDIDDIDDCSMNCDVVDRYKKQMDELINDLVEKQEMIDELFRVTKCRSTKEGDA